jgi:hypothetical protein
MLIYLDDQFVVRATVRPDFPHRKGNMIQWPLRRRPRERQILRVRMVAEKAEDATGVAA